MLETLIQSILKNVNKKLLILVTAFLTFYFLFFSLIPTYKLIKQNKYYQTELKKVDDAHKYLGEFKEKQDLYKKRLSTKYKNFEEVHEIILNSINKQKIDKDVFLQSIDTTDPELIDDKKLISLTTVALKGNYYHLLEVLNAMENNEDIGVIKKVVFSVEENQYQGEVDLFLTITLKNVKFV